MAGILERAKGARADGAVQPEAAEVIPITMEPGVYEVRRQVEDWMDEIRQVAD